MVSNKDGASMIQLSRLAGVETGHRRIFICTFGAGCGI